MSPLLPTVWEPLPLHTPLGDLAGSSILAVADPDNHVLGSVVAPRHDAGMPLRFMETLTTVAGQPHRKSREVNPALPLAAVCALVGVSPVAATLLPAINWLAVTPESVSAGGRTRSLAALVARVPTPQARRQQAASRVDAVKQEYGRLRGDVTYRIENAALFDPSSEATRQFETALVLWDDVDPTTPETEVVRRSAMVEVTFATARSAAETEGVAHLPTQARPIAELAAKSARLAQLSPSESERRRAVDAVATLLHRLNLSYLPDPTVLNRALPRL